MHDRNIYLYLKEIKKIASRPLLTPSADFVEHEHIEIRAGVINE